MNTTQTGAAIISEAKSWLDQGCKENPMGSNVVYCGDRKVTWNTMQNNTYWCAAFVSQVIHDALKKLGLPVSFPMTAGALDMLNKSKMGYFPVDKKPAPGAAFYRKSGSETATGHVGIVVNMDEEAFYTIEGNSADATGFYVYPYSDIPKRSFEFMHAEWIGSEDEDYNTPNPMEHKDQIVEPEESYTDGEDPVTRKPGKGTGMPKRSWRITWK